MLATVEQITEKIGAWFERFRRGARRRGVPARHAKDVAQKTSLRLLQAVAWLKRCENPEGASARVALNETRKHLRDERRRGEVLTSFDEHDIRDERWSPEHPLLMRDRRNVLARLLKQVPKKHRRILVKHKLWGVPLADIASEQGLGENTVKARFRRAWEHLERAAAQWQAEQRARGHDGRACAPVAFDLCSARWWKDALRNLGAKTLGAKTLAQSAFIALACTLSATDPLGSSAGFWSRLT